MWTEFKEEYVARSSNTPKPEAPAAEIAVSPDTPKPEAPAADSTANLVNLGADKSGLIKTGPLVGPGDDVENVDDNHILSNTTSSAIGLATRKGVLFVPAGGSKALSDAELAAVKDVAGLAVNRAYFDYGYLKFGKIRPDAALKAIEGREAPPDLRQVPPGLNIVSEEMM